MAALRRVFNVYELAEKIFLGLPLYEVVLASTVSRLWRQIISTSPGIRARLLSDRKLTHTGFSHSVCSAGAALVVHG